MKTEREKKQMVRRLARRMRLREKTNRKIEKLQIEIGRLSEVSYL